jgi:hypothetical protein
VAASGSLGVLAEAGHALDLLGVDAVAFVAVDFGDGGQLPVTCSEITDKVIPLGNADESHSLAS